MFTGWAGDEDKKIIVWSSLGRIMPPLNESDKTGPTTDEEERENPLLNHVVVNKLLSLDVLSFKDLKNFRLVCTLWHNASIELWANTAVVKLTPSTKIRAGFTIADLEMRYSRKVALRQLSHKPYSAYKVKGWKPKFDPVNSTVIPAEFSFGARVGPTVECLYIEQSNFSHPEVFEGIVFACENLKELVISGNTVIPQNRNYDPVVPEEKQLKMLKTLRLDGVMTLDWYQFMLHAPNVETLVFKQNNTHNRDSFSGFLMHHTQLQCRHKFKWPVKSLDLSQAAGTYTDLATLRYHEFPLETLTVQFEKYQVDQWFRPLLQGCAKTLRCLNIIRVSDRVDPPTYKAVDFPCGVHLDQLTELYLWGCVVDNLDFLRFTPLLKTLRINRHNFERRQLLPCSKLATIKKNYSLTLGRPGAIRDTAQKPVVEAFEDSVDVVQRTVGCWNNLAKQPVMVTEWLETMMIDCRLGVGSMYTLRRWIPNLKTFGMVFNNNTFLLACEEWPRLEEIRGLFGSIVTDEGVTGGYFLNMKALKRFRLDVYCNQGWFSDKAVHDGFLKIPSLRSLSVCVSKQMSDEAERLLREKIAQVKIIRNYGNGTHVGYDCCERMKYNEERKLKFADISQQNNSR